MLKKPEPYQPFSNTKEHFDAYIKARDVLSQEIKYRRDRQWEIIKWVSGLFLALIGFLFTLKTRNIHLDIFQLLTLSIVVLLLATVSCLRIVHDAGVVAHRHRVCRAMDKKFNLYFSDARHKLSSKVRRWWTFFQYRSDKSRFSYYAKKRMRKRRINAKPKSSLSFLSWCYIVFITIMAVMIMVSSWSIWDSLNWRNNRIADESSVKCNSYSFEITIQTPPDSLSTSLTYSADSK